MNNPLATAEFFIQLGKHEQAKTVLDLLKPYAVTMEQINAIAKLYTEIRDFETSLEYAYTVYKLAPEFAKFDARTNIIRSLLNLNRPQEALALIEENCRVDPDNQPNLMDKAMAFFLLNQKDTGESILRAIAANPANEDIANRVNFNLGTYNLRKGNYKEGLRQVLLDGRKLNIWKSFGLDPARFWEGQSAAGKRIVVCAEGGIGDEIISVRFMKHMRDKGMRPIWYTTRADLAEIFERNGFPTITDLQAIGDDCLWTYSMLAPVYLETEEADLFYGPYLTPINKPENQLISGSKKIGIKCSGNPKYDQDLHRTIPLADIIAAIPDEYEIYSFHIDEDIVHPRIIPLKDQIGSWDDTLDYLQQMDVVVSSCTSLIHAAGAIGKTAAVVVPVLTYYTWAAEQETSSWYGDNLRVFYQQECDNWRDPIKQLSEWLHGKS